MHNLIKTLSLTLAISLGAMAPAMTTVARAETGPHPVAAAQKPDLKKVGQHLREHQKYPATRAELLASCNDLVDFSAGEKRWYADHLPDGTYKSANEVLEALARK